jgi:hypothetical protein
VGESIKDGKPENHTPGFEGEGEIGDCGKVENCTKSFVLRHKIVENL